MVGLYVRDTEGSGAIISFSEQWLLTADFLKDAFWVKVWLHGTVIRFYTFMSFQFFEFSVFQCFGFQFFEFSL